MEQHQEGVSVDIEEKMDWGVLSVERDLQHLGAGPGVKITGA